MSTSTASQSDALAVEPNPTDIFVQRADALYRTAVECCRQHERLARLIDLGAHASEQKATQKVVCLCDEMLAEMTAAYEKAASRAHPADEDDCWHRANALWHASREFARRNRTCDLAARKLGERDDHSTARLGELTVDYDLYASALLALRHACEAYKKARPAAS
jgi:hypothetical protein